MKISFQANWIFVVKLYKFKTVWFKVFIAVAWFTLFLNVWLCLNQLYYWHGKLLMTVFYNGWRITRKNEWMSLCENLWRKTLLSHAFLLTLWRFSKKIFCVCEIQEKAANFQRYSYDKVIFNINYACRNDIVKILHRDFIEVSFDFFFSIRWRCVRSWAE